VIAFLVRHAIWSVVLFMAWPMALAHDWYAGDDKPMPDGSNRNCCGGHDCKPFPHRVDAGELNYEILVLGHWFKVDRRLVVMEGSPDGQVHACCHPGGQCDSDTSRYRVDHGQTPYFRCFWLPDRSS
jgi:hypothetical protein